MILLGGLGGTSVDTIDAFVEIAMVVLKSTTEALLLTLLTLSWKLLCVEIYDNVEVVIVSLRD
jgi:hypothetical protein